MFESIGEKLNQRKERNMILRQTLEKPIHGYWDGGAKQTFDWKIESSPKRDSKGEFVKIGSWAANHWFCVALGKTDKLTLANAKRRLSYQAKKAGISCKFEYREG